MSSGYYPAGAENDPNAPWNESDSWAELTVEVNVELGTFVNVALSANDGPRKFNSLVRDAVKKKLHIDNDEIVLNDLTICDYQ